jgi:diguanylate cyclase (GGDEF)-like protein/PAS domain S-box-containing protein
VAGTERAHGRQPWWYHAALEQLTDFVVVTDASGVILWTNPFVERLTGFGNDDGVGASIADFVHPDDLMRAAEVMTLMTDDGLGVPLTPAVYRIRSRDDTWTPVELNATVHPNDDGSDRVVIIVGRYSGDRALQDQILELLITGASPSEVIALVPQFGSWRHPEDHYAVIYTADDGRRIAVGDAASVQMVDFDVPEAPWTQAAAKDTELVIECDELPPELRAAALEAGLSACWAIPVEDPLHTDPAVIVAWSRDGAGSPEVHRYALQTMARSLQLILQWRQQVTSLRLAARRDPLTGLPNRTSFFEVLDGLQRSATGDLVGVLYVDLDGFKAVNDAHGHLVGDEVLVEAAQRIARVLRPTDTVARLGGDEFAVLCQELGDDEDAGVIAERIVAAFAEPFVVEGHRVTIGTSVGIATVRASELDGEVLLDSADQALYEAKNAGRGRWQLATP